MWSNANRRPWLRGKCRPSRIGSASTRHDDGTGSEARPSTKPPPAPAPTWSTRGSRHGVDEAIQYLRRRTAPPASAAPTPASCSCPWSVWTRQVGAGRRARRSRTARCWRGARTEVQRTQVIPRKRTRRRHRDRHPARRDHALDRLRAAAQRPRQALPAGTRTSRRRSPTSSARTAATCAHRRRLPPRDRAVPALLRAGPQGRRLLPALRPLHRREAASAPRSSGSSSRSPAAPAAAADRGRDPAARAATRRTRPRSRADATAAATADAERGGHRRPRSAASPARAGRAGRRAPSRSARGSGGGDCGSARLTDGRDRHPDLPHARRRRRTRGPSRRGSASRWRPTAEESDVATVKNFGDPGVRGPQLLGPAAQRPGLGRHRDHRQRHPGRAPGRGEGDRGVDQDALTGGHRGERAGRAAVRAVRRCARAPRQRGARTSQARAEAVPRRRARWPDGRPRERGAAQPLAQSTLA